MKSLLVILCLSVMSSVSFSGELDGRVYCRQVSTGGMFGQPKGMRDHCVSFENNMMTDNASTFFGNPPETVSYVLKESGILVNNVVVYLVNSDLTLIENNNGAQLTIR